MKNTLIKRQLIIVSSLVAMYTFALPLAANPAWAKAKRPTHTKKGGAAAEKKKGAPSPSIAAKDEKGQKAETEVVGQSPGQLIANRVDKILTRLKSRPVRIATGPSLGERPGQEVEAHPSKGAWLQTIYERDMIDHSWAMQMLSDKRLMAEVLQRELGDDAEKFYPKTIGLREFLRKKNFVNGKGAIIVSGEEIEEALHQEFPAGFMVRPAVGVAPRETSLGLYPDSDQLIVNLMNPTNEIFNSQHLAQPVKSHILQAVASGEAVVLQENIVNASDAKKPLVHRHYREVLVHTYEGRVVAGAVPSRWVHDESLSNEEIRRAENFVSELLRRLSSSLLTRQAWGVDVAVLDNGDMKITDIVTNRGLPIAWSSYLEQPRVIAAYSRHFEEFYGWKFTGVNGVLIRQGFANYLPFWEKRIEKAPRGIKKWLAYLPPLP